MDNFSTPLLFLLAIVVVTFLLSALKPKARGKFAYRISDKFLSNAERSFYGVLVQAVRDDYLVFAKVRIADVLSVGRGLNRSNWQRAFNAISSKHFDFILCDTEGVLVKLVIELDDASHNSGKRKKRDTLVDNACHSAALPILRIKAAHAYSVIELRQMIRQLLSPDNSVAAESTEVPAAVKAEEPPQAEQAPATKSPTAAGTEEKSPSCPKCGVVRA